MYILHHLYARHLCAASALLAAPSLHGGYTVVLTKHYSNHNSHALPFPTSAKRVRSHTSLLPGDHVLSACPRWLIFVEGVGYKPGAQGINAMGFQGDDEKAGYWWGGNLVGAKVSDE